MKKKGLKEQIGIKVNKNSKILVPGFKQLDKEIICHIDAIDTNDFIKLEAKELGKYMDTAIIGALKENAVKVEGTDILEVSAMATQEIYKNTLKFTPNVIIAKNKKLVKAIASEYEKVLEFDGLKENEVLFIVNQPDFLLAPFYHYTNEGIEFDEYIKYNKDLVVLGVLK